MMLWISGTCLSPMPWMLCSPKPFSSSVGHSRASAASTFVPCRSFRYSPAAMVPADPVALVMRAMRVSSRPVAACHASKACSRAGPVAW